MLDPKEMLTTLVRPLAVTAQVQNVFGEPIEAHGKTVIPVAACQLRFRRGRWRWRGQAESEKTIGGGGGGGGGESHDRSARWKLPRLARVSSASSIHRGWPRFVAGGIAIGLAVAAGAALAVRSQFRSSSFERSQ